MATSVSMKLTNKFYSYELVEVARDYVILRDWREHSTDAHESTIVVKIDGIENRRDVLVPIIRYGECRVDIEEPSAERLAFHEKNNVKSFVMACDGRVSPEEAEEIAERHILDCIERDYR